MLRSYSHTLNYPVYALANANMKVPFRRSRLDKILPDLLLLISREHVRLQEDPGSGRSVR